MKSFIEPQKNPKKEKLTVNVDVDVTSTLKQYVQFLESDAGYVVGAILRKAFRKDKAFAAWLSDRSRNENAHGTTGGRRTGSTPVAAAS
jgi:hypothetical protein